MNDYPDIGLALMVDGNAVAGMLVEVFGTEMTASPAECAHCAREGELGSLLAFTHGPGVVLRCPGCHNVVLRIARARDRFYIDARGAAFLCIPIAVQ